MAGVCPTGGIECARFQKSMDVMYLKNIKHFKDRLKSTYFCNQQQCPVIRERLDQHQQEHHSTSKIKVFTNQGTETPEHYCSRRERTHDQGIAMSPEMSRSCMSAKSIDHTKPQTTFSTKTDFSIADFTPMDSNLGNCCAKHYLDNNVESGRESTSVNDVSSRSFDIPIKHSETREVLTPKSNFYKEYVQNEVFKWLQDVPMHPNLDVTSKILRDNIVNSLIYKINELSVNVIDENYEDRLKFETNAALNKLPIWLPGTKRDLNLLIINLTIDLLERIRQLNNKHLTDQNKNNENPRTCSRDKNQTITFFDDEAKHAIENEINEWLSRIKIRNDNSSKVTSKKEVVEHIFNRLAPLLNEAKHNSNNRLTIKREIVKLLDGLPVCVKCPRNRMALLNRFADELTNRLLKIKAKYNSYRCFSDNKNRCKIQRINDFTCSTSSSNDLKHNLIKKLRNCIEITDIIHTGELECEITDVINEYLEFIRSGEYVTVTEKICSILCNYSGMHESKAFDIAKDIVKHVKYAVNEDSFDNVSTKTLIQPRLSGVISVYTSEEKLPSNYPITSTPKKTKIPKSEIPKLNPEELSYMEKVAVVIREWMITLPKQFDTPEEKGFKETMIYDLAGDIMDEVKNEQITPQNNKQELVKYTILRWMAKLNICDDYDNCQTEIDDLYSKIYEIPIPIMTRPQHGTRQAMENIKFIDQVSESSLAYKEYVPKGMEVLEDEISIWMNEQPNKIYVYEDRSIRNKMIHELAEQLQDDLVNKKPEKVIHQDVAQWLNKVIKPDDKANLPDLIEDLRERVKKLPQDVTLRTQFKERLKERIEKCKLKRLAKESENKQVSSTMDHEDDNSEKTMKEFIAKYIQHNYEVDDPIARRALSHLLKQEIRRLSPPTRKEVYDNFTKSQPSARLAPERFRQELDYIKIISDWLNDIPIDPEFNTLGNTHRVEFITTIAKNVIEMEDERRNAPEAMDYDAYLNSLIFAYIVQLPISKIQMSNMAGIATQLINRINNYQNHIIQQQEMKQLLELGDFVEEFIIENGADIGNDPLKLEAWSARLMKEIIKIVHETSDPATLCKNQVYSRLAEVPKPGDESLELFSLELEYIEQISEWLKNLPLLPISNEIEEYKRVGMISELAEKMAERQTKVIENPNDSQIDVDFIDYVTQWIQEVPLDPKRPIDMMVILRQLIKRMERVMQSKLPNEEPHIPPNQTCPPTCKKSPKSKSSSTKLKQNPGKLTIEAVEKFCNALHIQGDNSDSIKATKDGVAKNIFKKIGELNMDPRIFNDNLLYKEILLDGLDKEIENIPQNPQLQKNIGKLKTNLIETILEAKNAIIENSAGENYKKHLENSIEASIPYPINSKHIYEPGFEIYKSHLAAKFILDNFDHSNEDIKLRYETRIRAEIDKYFQSALKKNAVPLTKDQMYNELYSSLFKVPIPHETSIADEVKVIKTRCEIDTWFQNLPLKEVNSVNEQLELDKILSALAIRIHEIEKNDQNPDKKMHNEIAKWVIKLPLSVGNEGRVNEFSNKLVSALRSSAQDRKYVPVTRGKKGKGKKSKPKPKAITNTENMPLPLVSSAQPAIATNQGPSIPHKKPTELILETVQTWCQQLPLTVTTLQEEQNVINIKENLITKIILKISELNSNPVVFADDLLYDQLLDEELEIIISPLPTCCEFQQSKEIRKSQLKHAIKMIKPLIREEKARHDYKQDLKNTVVSILEEPHNKTVEKVEEFNNLVEEIVDDFVQYNYIKGDDEGKLVFKMKVHDAVVKYFVDIAEQNQTDGQVDPLIRRNQLICELQKVLEPSKAVIQEEVEEIRMKKEVAEFFEEISIPAQNTTLKNQMKKSLAKRLIDLEQNGHNIANETKMKSVINRCLKKFNKEVSPQIVDAFINKLRNNEMVRKAPSPRDEQEEQAVNEYRSQHLESPMSLAQSASPSAADESGPQWISLHDPNFHLPHVIRELRPSKDDVWCAYGHGIEERQNLEVSAVSFQGFGAGVPFSSSVIQQRAIQPNVEESRSSRLAANANSAIQPCVRAQIVPPGTPQVLPVTHLAQEAAAESCVPTCPNRNAATETHQSVPSSDIPVTLQMPAQNAPSSGPIGTFTTQPSEPGQVMRLAVPRAAGSSDRRTRTTESEQYDNDDGGCRCRWKEPRRNRRISCFRPNYHHDFYSHFIPLPPLMWRIPIIRGLFFF